jgi:MFS family permease
MSGIAERSAAALVLPSRPYAAFVLTVLVAVYAFNFMDRYVFVIMMEDIKRDLSLSDTQLGLLSGFAFSAVYSISGLGVARWADRGNRRTIIAFALAAWSTFTIVCGQTRNFAQVFLARTGVGVSESACSPPAFSLLADYFPPRRRAKAYAVYTSGTYIGLGLGFIVGGWVGEHYGWRAAFLAVGAPGLLAAILVRFAICEPVRGAADEGITDTTHYRLGEAASYFWQRPAFVAYMMGSALYVLAGTAIDNWAPLYLERIHHLPSDEVGLWTGVLATTAGLSGAVCSGIIADRLSQRDLRLNLWVATAGIALVVPGTILFVFGPSRLLFVLYAITTFFNSFYMPPTVAITQRLVPVRLRALASAVMLLGYNVVGTAGCNFAIGYLSDRWAPALQGDSIRYAMAAVQIAAVLGAACTLFGIARLPRDFAEHFRS